MADISLKIKIKRALTEWGLGFLGFLLPAIISYFNNNYLTDQFLIGVFSVIAYLAGAVFIVVMVVINRENAKEEATLSSKDEIDTLTLEVSEAEKRYEAFCRGYSLRDPRKECIAALNDVAIFIDTEVNLENVSIFIKLKIEDINNNIYLSMSVHDFIDFVMENDGVNIFDANHPCMKRTNFSELKEKVKKVLEESSNRESNEFSDKNQFLTKMLIRHLTSNK